MVDNPATFSILQKVGYISTEAKDNAEERKAGLKRYSLSTDLRVFQDLLFITLLNGFIDPKHTELICVQGPKTLASIDDMYDYIIDLIQGLWPLLTVEKLESLHEKYPTGISILHLMQEMAHISDMPEADKETYLKKITELTIKGTPHAEAPCSMLILDKELLERLKLRPYR